MKIWDHIKSVFMPTVPAEPPASPVEAVPIPSVNAKHSRTDHEKNLISEFRTLHGDLLEKLEDAVYDCNRRMKKAEDPAVKAELCRKTISAYNKLKTVCNNTGPGGALYFEDMWEHCSNSVNPDFRFIDPVEEILKELKG